MLDRVRRLFRLLDEEEKGVTAVEREYAAELKFREIEFEAAKEEMNQFDVGVDGAKETELAAAQRTLCLGVRERTLRKATGDRIIR